MTRARGIRFSLPVLALSAVLALGCESGTGPVDAGRSLDELNLVRFDPDLFDRVPRDTSFWAKRGENRGIDLHYGPGGEYEGERFLRFRVSSRSLERRPDGTPFEEGDSIRIGITVDPEGRFLFDFQPAGLTFSPDDPAELRIDFRRGLVDRDDPDYEARIRIWKEESQSGPWIPLLTLRIDKDDVRAEVLGFSGFALAS